MSFRLIRETALQYWAQLDCSTSLRCAILARYEQWAEVLTLTVSPEHFADPYDYAKANAAVCFLKKNSVLEVPGISDEDRRKAALDSWMAGEASCYRANERISPYLISPLSDEMPAQFLRRVRRRLVDWLGYGPDDDELKARARHGPGTTFSSTVANPTAADKYTERMTITSGAAVHLLNLAGTKWMELNLSAYPDCPFEFVRGNRHTVVPKTALTDRNIGIEATVNIYWQLGLGSSIRARMRKRAGWDLDNAAFVHRKMAQTASADGSYATLDLTNASDSLCKNLVKFLFHGTSWLGLMEDLRSPLTRVDGQWHLLEKFSSMGNGYTFELESCIFAAIAAECLEIEGYKAELGKNLFVFGDDIIVPTECFRLVVAALRWCGFETNPKKTFAAGNFRESCGGDFFNGIPVRGYYLKSALSKRNVEGLFALLNGACACLERCGLKADAFRDWVLPMIPKHLQLAGPARLGDSVLHYGGTDRFRWKNGILWRRAVKWSAPVLIGWKYFSDEARIACRLTSYGHTWGIDSRGKRSVAEVMWVSDS